MPRRLKPHDIVATLYEEEGFYEVWRSEEAVLGAAGRLLLSDGGREIAVNILDEDSFMSKGALHDALLEAEKLLERYEGAVLAVPRRFQRAVDEAVLLRHGIGLVIYDSMGAEEVVPPRLREKPMIRESAPQTGKEKIQGEELVKLRSELSKLMRVLEELEARLDRLEREQRGLSVRLSRLEASRPIPEEAEPMEKASSPTPKPGGALPSYLQDNPWVEILSRRE